MNRVYHLVIVQTLGRWQRHSPGALESLSYFGIVDRLIAGQEIRHRSVVAGPLHVVVASQWVGARTGPHIVSAYQKQVRDSGRRVGAIAVLGNSHRPEDTDAFGTGNRAGYLLQHFDRKAARLGGKFESERLQALAVLVEVVHPPAEEVGGRQTIVEKIPAERGKPYQVGSGPRVQENIRTPRHLVLPQIRDNQLLSVQLVRPLDARGQN